jgi:SAM-dependent methyltransferase
MSNQATQVYALGADEEETARLRRQSEELRPEAEALLARTGLRPGQSAVDLGCGPSGILGLLAAAVSPSGTVIGVDANAAHVAAARRYAAPFGNVEVLAGDARHTGLPGGAFDLVHARTLLVTVPGPGEVVAEMTRLARPGGWIACQEPDTEHALCYPPLPEWDRLRELFHASFGRRSSAWAWRTNANWPPSTGPSAGTSPTRASSSCRTCWSPPWAASLAFPDPPAAPAYRRQPGGRARPPSLRRTTGLHGMPVPARGLGLA